ncbi:uncharacterized protein BYT42DRAFT_496844 [Radiomyces spectabilis]|uniref:uncharacterized protein n=1 Tax=Radiomyces spectabilis TaxID=64574 RepID=UPI00221FE13E|nr:uncharacterized protein BYT42DRAFT_496844 [Radiomyces spectabilis]KAI8377849.1 hypothetical protein BYT42DRAFT_496844 [Radiomyces spectabilis]
MGGLRVGKANALVPDASAEHPLVLSDPEQQPLCVPDAYLEASAPFNVMQGYEAYVLANSIKNPRKIAIDRSNHILVVAGGEGVYSIRMDKCGNTDIKKILGNELDQPVAHGLALFGHSVYVATANSVYQFAYSDGQHSELKNGVKVLTNINPSNPNAQPDVAIDPFGHAYVPRSAVGLQSDVDPRQAIIKKFNFRAVPEGGYDFETDGQIHAFGTNSVGSMAFDAQARLWGIDAPFESFQRADIGGDVSQTGLAEEVNLYEFPQHNYGYPYCFTEYNMESYTPRFKGLGAQWAHPAFMNDSVDMDSYCQQEERNRRPAVPLAPGVHAHSIYFYMGTFCSVGDLETLATSVGLPCNWTDTPIVAYHGVSGQSQGHSVVHLPFDDLGHVSRWDKPEEVIFAAASPCTGAGCISPIDIAVDGYGRLIISSDESNEIFLVHRIYNELAAQMLTDKDNKKEALKEAAEEALEGDDN